MQNSKCYKNYATVSVLVAQGCDAIHGRKRNNACQTGGADRWRFKLPGLGKLVGKNFGWNRPHCTKRLTMPLSVHT